MLDTIQYRIRYRIRYVMNACIFHSDSIFCCVSRLWEGGDAAGRTLTFICSSPLGFVQIHNGLCRLRIATGLFTMKTWTHSRLGCPTSSGQHIQCCAGFLRSWPSGLGQIFQTNYVSLTRARTSGQQLNSTPFSSTTLCVVLTVIFKRLAASNGNVITSTEDPRHDAIPSTSTVIVFETKIRRYHIHIAYDIVYDIVYDVACDIVYDVHIHNITYSFDTETHFIKHTTQHLPIKANMTLQICI